MTSWLTINKQQTIKQMKEYRFMTTTKKLTEKQMDKRNARIQKMYSTGKFTHRSLAKVIGLSKTSIGRILQ